jgi:hypothetical protein
VLLTVLVPPLACSARVFDALMSRTWAHGAATIADTRREASRGGDGGPAGSG